LPIVVIKNSWDGLKNDGGDLVAGRANYPDSYIDIEISLLDLNCEFATTRFVVLFRA
jgi:hypothetical protein